MKEPLSFVSLEVENVLRLKAFKMTMGPDGLVVIEAKNSQGKSSALHTLEMALAGMSDAPHEPLRDGAKKGYVIATFDGITVKRVFRAGKDSILTVTLPNGTKVKGPQTFLSALFTRRCLRPTKLMDAREAEQVATVSEIMGFEPKKYDAEVKRLYDLRTDANRDAERLANVASAAVFHKDAPHLEVSASKLMVELNKRRDHNESIRDKQTEIQDAAGKITECSDKEGELIGDGKQCAADINALEEQISALKLEQIERRKALARAKDTTATAQAEAEAMRLDYDKMSVANEDEIIAQVNDADAINAKVRDNDKREKAKEEANAADVKAERLNTELTAARETREEARLAACERLSIPGLDITEERLLFNGVPFSQAGNSDQLRVCVAVAIKGNKDKQVRMLLIDDAEKLDADSTELVMQMARADGYQVIMTKVIARTEDASESSVVIEDGANA